MRSLILPALLVAAAATALPLSIAAQERKLDVHTAPLAVAAEPASGANRGDASVAPEKPAEPAPAATPRKVPSATPPVAAKDRISVLAMTPEQENAFATSLIRQLSSKADPGKLDNAILCPGGVTRLLRALGAGAKGHTASEIAKALAVGSKTPLAISDAATPAEFEDALKVASALWSDTATPFLPAFEYAMKETLGASTQEAPLVKDPEAARKTINAWAAENTGGNIQELLKAGELRSNARLVLTDTAWFKDTWKLAFKPQRTSQQDFTLPDGTKRNVAFVADIRAARVGSTADAEALALPFATPRFECLCLLPVMKPKETSGAALLRFERGLNPEILTALSAALSEQKRVDILLPKLDLKGLNVDMMPPLKGLGVKTVFTDSSDLSGMTGKGKQLKVGLFKQDTSFRLDENGAEASAATAVVMVTKSAVALAKPVVFHADRPCLFVIRDTNTGGIIFFIRCAAPAEAPKTAAAPGASSEPAPAATTPGPVDEAPATSSPKPIATPVPAPAGESARPPAPENKPASTPPAEERPLPSKGSSPEN